jgi:hypothetical protein
MLIIIFYQNKNVGKTPFNLSNKKVIFFGLCLYINKRQIMCDEVEEKRKLYKMIPMFSTNYMCILKIKNKILM